ncbi:MAG: hypothetical protein ACRDDY_03355 [Clostridium sp.]|uniref:hypothetical protein n=1 Tax=Clostridium sp. TaxID=1506 RepID=UPI003EE67E35
MSTKDVLAIIDFMNENEIWYLETEYLIFDFNDYEHLRLYKYYRHDRCVTKELYIDVGNIEDFKRDAEVFMENIY